MKMIGSLLVFTINVYLIILMVRVVLSWLHLPRKKWMDYIQKITDPVLNFFRKQTPIRIGMFDLSIIVPFILLNVLRVMIRDLMIDGREFTSLYFFGAVVRIVSMLFGWACSISLILTIAMFFILVTRKGGSHPIVMTINSFFNPILAFFRRILPIRSEYSSLIYLFIFGIIIAIAWGVIGGQLTNLIAWLNTQEPGSVEYLFESTEDTFDYP